MQNPFSGDGPSEGIPTLGQIGVGLLTFGFHAMASGPPAWLLRTILRSHPHSGPPRCSVSSLRTFTKPPSRFNLLEWQAKTLARCTSLHEPPWPGLATFSALELMLSQFCFNRIVEKEH